MKSATSNTSDRTQPLQTNRFFAATFAKSWLGAFALLLAEAIGLLVIQRRSISSVWELQVGLAGLLPSWAVVSLPCALLATLLGMLLLGSSVSPGPRRRLILAGIASACAGAVAWGVGGGRHLATLPLRGSFALAVGLIAAAAAFFGAGWLHTLFKGPRLRAGSVVGVAILLVEFANLLVLVRLYPAFHLGLSGVALVGTGLLVQIVSPPNSENSQLRLGINYRIYYIFLTCLLLLSSLAIPASRAIAGFDNFRFLMLEGPPSAALGVRVASLIEPPPDLDEAAAALPLGAARSHSGPKLSFQGKTILLISIDALRADHLGCYGYQRPTSPAMDALAKDGVRFDAAYAPTPHTSYSITSLMTGKYMRPLLLQDSGHDSELWATLLQTYGYRTAAFFPPAVFFIDKARFKEFRNNKLGFEYAWVEFAEGSKRLAQVNKYLEQNQKKQPFFLWVHLFGPHEPYEKDERFDFGDQDRDRYDSEIRAADATVEELVRTVRGVDPGAVVILTADHGEEFGEHGGRYHGTSVYDEQVRVPLLISAPGVEAGRIVHHPVQTIDLLPTVLEGLDIVIPPRIRGNSLLPDLSGKAPDPSTKGLAVSETDDYLMLAEGRERLICQRKTSACRLFDLSEDPAETHDLTAARPERTRELKERLRQISSTHGRFESQGLREGGKGWPRPIVLGLSGNAEVAPELAHLLDDADVAVRRKAAELLLNLGTTAEAPALRLALTREEDEVAQAWIALGITRLGQGAPLVVELLKSKDENLRRRAALVLAETGDDLGESELIAWFMDKDHREHTDALAILNAFARLRSRKALYPLIAQLGDVRLRAEIARTLAAIGDKDAKGPLTLALREERFQSARAPLSRALLQLGAKEELILPVRRFLGVPDPLETGLAIALDAGILDDVGGPKDGDLRRLKQLSDSGVQLKLVVPPRSSESAVPERDGARLLVRVRARTSGPKDIYVQSAAVQWGKKATFRSRPQIREEESLVLKWPGSVVRSDGWTDFQEIYARIPPSFGAKPGHALSLEVYASSDLEISALAVVPLSKELPPPPPKPWKGADDGPRPEEPEEP